MRIEITRSGGFGGLTRSWSLEVSRTEAEERWLPLAAEAGASTDPAAGTPSSAGTAVAPDTAAPGSRAGAHRDRFTYRIVIGYTEVLLPESELDDPWHELIDRARSAASAPVPTSSPSPDRPDGPGPGAPSHLL